MDVRMPDGTVIRNVPEGTTKAQLMERLGRTEPTAQLQEPLTSRGQFAEGLGKGITDVITGVQQLGLQQLIDRGIIPREQGEERLKSIAEGQRESQQRFEEFTGDSTAAQLGEFVGEAVPFAAVPLGGIARGGQALARGAQAIPKVGSLIGGAIQKATPLAAGAAGGGIAGATLPEEEFVSVEESLARRGEQAQMGAGAGALLTAGGTALAPRAAQAIQGLGSAARKVFDRRVSPYVNQLVGETAENAADLARVGELQNILTKESDALAKRIGKRFERAEQLGQNVTLAPDDINHNLITQLQADADTAIGEGARGAYQSAIRAINDLQSSGNLTINRLQGLRRSATNTSRTGGDTGFAAGQIVRQIDDYLDEALKRGAVQGDKGAVSAWKNAIKDRRDFAARFENPVNVKKALNEDATVEEISQLFFSGSPANARKASSTFDQVLKAAGKQAPQAKSLMKQAIVNKMFRQASKAAPDDMVKVRFLANEIDNLKNNNPSLWNKFDEGERKALSGLSKNLRAAETAPPLNRLVDFAFRTLNKVPGANLAFQLPTTAGLQQLRTFDDVVKLLDYNPASGRELPPAVRNLGVEVIRRTGRAASAGSAREVANGE